MKIPSIDELYNFINSPNLDVMLNHNEKLMRILAENIHRFLQYYNKDLENK